MFRGKLRNVGIACGHGFVVLDGDGPEGVASIAKFVPPHFPRITTPTGCLHVPVRIPEGMHLATRLRFLPGVELRSSGAQVLVFRH
jgi:hypothetical protein